jgi:hypothetical protein
MFSIFLFLKVKILEWYWQWQVRKVHYQHTPFKIQDQAFLKAYRFKNPYRISKLFMQQRGEENVHVYGETPLPVYHRIATRWGIGKKHQFLELGCGRGRGLLFLSHIHGCQCIGIEWIAEFVNTIKKIEPSLKIYHEDFMRAQIISRDFIYLYGTCLEEDHILALCERFLHLPSTTKIITVSFSLSEYHKRFKLIDSFIAHFPWGRGEIFLNVRGD